MMCIKIMVMCMYFTHSKVENKQLCFQEYILNHNVYTGYKESWFFSLPFVQLLEPFSSSPKASSYKPLLM